MVLAWCLVLAYILLAVLCCLRPGPQVTTKLQGKAGDIVNKVAALTLDAIDSPMQQLINKLVDDLESSATAAAFKEIRQKLVEYKLVSPEAAA